MADPYEDEPWRVLEMNDMSSGSRGKGQSKSKAPPNDSEYASDDDDDDYNGTLFIKYFLSIDASHFVLSFR